MRKLWGQTETTKGRRWKLLKKKGGDIEQTAEKGDRFADRKKREEVKEQGAK